jgi:hypothetical protein
MPSELFSRKCVLGVAKRNYLCDKQSTQRQQGDFQMAKFFTASDARAFIAQHDFAAFELEVFTGSDNVEVERDGHCGFVANGQVHFLGDADLIAFADHLAEA